MSSNRILLVTFPVDLGNRTLEANQKQIFSNDMDFYRFAEGHATAMDHGKISLFSSIMYRLRSAYELRKVVREYTKQGKRILFNGLSPALFSYGVWKSQDIAIVFDWTRTLPDWTLGLPIKKDALFRLQRKVLRDCPTFLCWTDSIMENLEQVYGVKRSALFKVHAPFLTENLDIPPRPTPSKPRVLFVGGDLKRKGGDVLLDGWKKSLKDKCTLTMMTNDPSANVDGIHYLPGVTYGSEIHRKTYEEHDILILPTNFDAYPQVIGEAAAAGLAVITTKFALGAKEVVLYGESGYITDSQSECLTRLEDLISSPARIDEFKLRGYNHMHAKFSREAIRSSYLNIVAKELMEKEKAALAEKV
jgi:glycosyltransferase involved in cell wall biosynthesis